MRSRWDRKLRFGLLVLQTFDRAAVVPFSRDKACLVSTPIQPLIRIAWESGGLEKVLLICWEASSPFMFFRSPRQTLCQFLDI
jgi:hypothetical protein